VPNPTAAEDVIVKSAPDGNPEPTQSNRANEEFSPAPAAGTSANAPEVRPDYDQSIDFLRRMHPGRRWVLTSISLNKRAVVTATFSEAKEAECRRWLEAQGAASNLYFSTNEVSRDVGKKAERADIANVHYLHVDVDPRAGEDVGAEQRRILGVLREPPGLPPPTVVVASGGGYQAFWKLAAPIPVEGLLEKAEAAKLYNLAIELKIGADNCHNVDRVMRLPGSLNRPCAAKLKKGRTLVMAAEVERHDDRVYDIGRFEKAPAADFGGAGGRPGSLRPAAKVDAGSVARFATLDDPTFAKVSDKGKLVIAQGNDPDEPNRFTGRSEWLFFACCEMVRGGVSDQDIYSVITDPDWLISGSVLDKGSMVEKYARRQIERAREDAIHPWLVRLNDKHTVIANYGGKCRVIEEQFDEAMQRSRLTKQNFDDFRNRYSNIKVDCGVNKDGMPIRVPLGIWWLGHEQRKQADRIVFAPGREVPDAYNLWRGFACGSKPGDCSLFLAHLRENVCQGDPARYDYLIRWMARAVQTPDSPGYSAIVMKGGQGTGKSFVAKTFGSLFGRHYMQVTDPKHLIGSFNAHLRDCVVLFGDEAFYAGDKKHESTLKMLVTEETITFEGKGVDAEAGNNCIHLMMASNERWVVPAATDDRRYFVLDVGDGRKNDGAYFKAIQAQLDADGREALLHHLQTLDLSGFNVRDVPKTDALREQQAHTASQGLTGLVRECYLTGTLPLGEKRPAPRRGRPAKSDPLMFVRVDAGQLLAHANAVLLKQRSGRAVGAAELIDFLQHKLGIAYKASNGSAPYFLFPPLAEARRAWDERLFPVPWAKYAAAEDPVAGEEEEAEARSLSEAYAGAGFGAGPNPTAPESGAGDLTGWRLVPQPF
jgi:hypothetical protein